MVADNFIFIPKEMDSKGWKKMVDGLREMQDSLEFGGNMGCNKGGQF